MKDTHDRKTADLIAPRPGRPAVYQSEEARQKAAREKAAARQRAKREREKDQDFDLSGLLLLEKLVLEHSPESERVLEILHVKIEKRRNALIEKNRKDPVNAKE